MSLLYWRLIKAVAPAVPVNDEEVPRAAFSFSCFSFLSLIKRKKKTTCFFHSPCLTRSSLSAQTVAGLFLADSVRLVEPCQNQRASYLTLSKSLRGTVDAVEEGNWVCKSATSWLKSESAGKKLFHNGTKTLNQNCKDTH